MFTRYVHRILLIALVLTGAGVSYVRAAIHQGTCGTSVNWTLDTETGVLAITGSGDMNNFSLSGAPWYSYRNSIITVTIGEGVTTVGSNSFYEYDKLQSLALPSTITSIKSIYRCPALADIYVSWTNPPAYSSGTLVGMYQPIRLHIPCGTRTKYENQYWHYRYTLVGNVNYTLTAQSANAAQGKVQIGEEDAGSTIQRSVPCEDRVQLKALAADGFHFVQWQDGDRNPIRTVTVASDSTMTASFAANTPCSIRVKSKDSNGLVQLNDGAFVADTTAVITDGHAWLTADGINCCVFEKWTDGNTDNPRFISVNSDSIFTAQFKSTAKQGSMGTNVTFRVCGDSMRIYGTGTIAKNSNWTGTAAAYPASKQSNRDLSPIEHIVIEEGIKGSASQAFIYTHGPKTLSIPSTMTSIGSDFMLRCYTLESIVVADGNPNYDSRENCNAIIRKSDKTLILGCQNTVIPEGVLKIGDYAFEYCYPLKEITFPKSLTSYGYTVFKGCESLTDIYVTWDTQASVPNHRTMCTEIGHKVKLHIPCGTSSYYRNRHWDDEFDLSEDWPVHLLSADPTMGRVQIGDGALGTDVKGFAPCGGDTTIYAEGNECYHFVQWSDGNTQNPRTISVNSDTTFTAIFEEFSQGGKCGAEGNGDNLNWLLSCDSVLTISGTGQMADYNPLYNNYAPWYSYRKLIKRIDIRSGVTSIGNHAFDSCSYTLDITIPASLTRIGGQAFVHCDTLESVYISDLEAWCRIQRAEQSSSPAYRNYQGALGGKLYLNNQLVTDLHIPNGITTVNAFAFLGFTCITSIDFNQVTAIDERAFACCHNLQTVTIPEPIDSIGHHAFAYCSSLQHATIPKTATDDLGPYIFYNCEAMQDIHVGWTNAADIPFWPSLTSKTPQSSVTLYVPCGTESIYAAKTGWKDYTIDGGGSYTVTVQTATGDTSMGTVSIVVN